MDSTQHPANDATYHVKVVARRTTRTSRKPATDGLDGPPGMSPPAQRFVAALTPLMRVRMTHLLGILDSLGEDDLAVFTARKAACAADGLRRAGLWQPRSPYTSTRALDGDISVVAGRDVVLVEDIASSGRTMKKSIERLRDGNPRSIRCFAMTVEGDLLAVADFQGVEFITPPVQAELKDNLLHAQSIIWALWALPRPYN